MALAPSPEADLRLLDPRHRSHRAELGIDAYQMRTYKELDEIVGKRATYRLADVGERFS